MKRLSVLIMIMVCLSVSLIFAAEKIGGGDLTFTPKNALPVLFSHNGHVIDKSLKCTDCHYQIFQMAKDSYQMNMKTLSKGDFCGKCHDGRRAFDVQDKKNCSRCHR